MELNKKYYVGIRCFLGNPVMSSIEPNENLGQVLATAQWLNDLQSQRNDEFDVRVFELVPVE